MERIEIENKHILTRQELHDLMISYNFTMENKIDEIKLSKSIYDLDENIYNQLIDNILLVYNPRNKFFLRHNNFLF